MEDTFVIEPTDHDNYKIDFSKVKTVSDLKAILMAMNLHITINKGEKIPAFFKEIIERNLLIKQ